MVDETAPLGYLSSPAPSSPPRQRLKAARRPRPPRPIPWRKVAKLHIPLGVALVAYELLHLAADLQPVIVATWASLVAAVSAAVTPALATGAFALLVVVLRRRR